MINVNICTLSDNETVLFAAEELKKYLKLLNESVEASITSNKANDDECITVGLWDKETSDVDTTVVDIDVLSGKLLGSNPRSVLFAVYQYLEAIGVRWVRHGDDGEYVPENHDFSKDSVHFQRTPKYFHRAMMMEGALSLKNSLDNIDWCAKVGFNEYYIQYVVPTFFYKSWYQHTFNPLLEKQHLTSEDYEEINARITREIKKRGMILYVVGHGWHYLGFDFPQKSEELTDEQRSMLAQIGGKRDYNNNSLSATHLCYSQEKVRKGIANYVIKYLKTNPDADILMFPLADGHNNHCECEECSKYIPSDLYVTLLNEIDELMTKHGFKQKIVVTIYTDYLWRPSKFKLKNPDRFLYCYAPFHKKNDKSYKQMNLDEVEIPPYTRNKLVMPSNVEDLIAHLKSWQDWQMLSGFDHEYYYYVGEHYYDFGSVFLANIIYEDIQSLEALKLDGMMSCQSQRSFMPTGLGSYVMIKTLWDDSVDFNALKKEYFDGAFGSESDTFNKYLSYLSEIVHKDKTVPYDKVVYAVKQMAEYIKNLDTSSMNKCFAASIKYIAFHCELLLRQCAAEDLHKREGLEKAKEKWLELIKFVRLHELEVQSVFDLMQYFAHLRRLDFSIKALYLDELPPTAQPIAVPIDLIAETPN